MDMIKNKMSCQLNRMKKSAIKKRVSKMSEEGRIRANASSSDNGKWMHKR